MMKTAKTETKWEISVVAAIKETITVTVPKNCTTAELYDEVKKHPLAPVAEQHILISTEGELEYSKQKCLADYDIQNKSTLQLTARVSDNGWPSVNALEARSRLLKASETMKITTAKKRSDVFGLDDDTPRAIMDCGHAVAPLSLALHCHHELEKGEESIKCPSPGCDTRWKFSQIREAACLSTNESHEFERKALLNRMKKDEEIKSCPKCSAFCTRSNNSDKRIVCSNCTARSGNKYEFCWICLRQWKDNGTVKCGNPECSDNKAIFHVLATCTLKALNGVNCPSKRACPKCITLVEHTKKHKHVTCGGCKYEFCFICLQPYPCETDVWDACDVAPRQTPTVIRPATTGGGRWQINVRSHIGWLHVNVPANCFVGELFRLLYDHPQAPKVCGYRVMFNNDQRKMLFIKLSGSPV